MVKEKSILIYIDPLEKDDPVIFALKLPLKRKVMLLSNQRQKVANLR